MQLLPFFMRALLILTCGPKEDPLNGWISADLSWWKDDNSGYLYQNWKDSVFNPLMASVLDQLELIKGTTRTNSDIIYSLTAAVIVTIVGILLIIHKIRIGMPKRSSNIKARELCDNNMMKQGQKTECTY